MSRVRAAEPVRMASPTPPDLKGLQYLSQEERNARRPTLPPGEGFWVFGYGSLMWHPGFPHVEEIGRAHVCTPVTNAHLVCRLLLEKTKNTITHDTTVRSDKQG